MRFLLDGFAAWAAETFSRRRPHSPRRAQLLVDVSVIYRHDARTGIQRVVRAVWTHLQVLASADFEVVAVAASAQRSYRLVPSDFLENAQRVPISALPKVGACMAGDIFFGLDLSAHIIPRRAAELLRWRRQGCRLSFMVYDLLPVQNPKWFSEKLVRRFRRWLHFITRYGDQAICISSTVASNLERWIQQRQGDASRLSIHPVKLGADLSASLPSVGVSAQEDDALAASANGPILLCVGTIEPRKGHDSLLDAFEAASKRRADISLFLLGRPGWKTDRLQQRLNRLQETHARFYWFPNSSDEFLGTLYQNCDLVIVPSLDEGFGLPISEATQYGSRVLARDIPVFRELDGPGVSFFSDNDENEFADKILALVAQERPTRPIPSDSSSWKECVLSITRLIRLEVGQGSDRGDF